MERKTEQIKMIIPIIGKYLSKWKNFDEKLFSIKKFVAHKHLYDTVGNLIMNKEALQEAIDKYKQKLMDAAFSEKEETESEKEEKHKDEEEDSSWKIEES